MRQRTKQIYLARLATNEPGRLTATFENKGKQTDKIKQLRLQ